GIETNLRWLRDRYGNRVEPVIADVRDYDSVARAVANVSEVYHLVGRAAVTASPDDPPFDPSVDASGTLNLLEALRTITAPPPVFFASTNNVIGDVDSCSPYQRSNGSADQYVLDRAHTCGVPAVVFRMSCVYGPHQLRTDEQGWVAQFLIQALEH